MPALVDSTRVGATLHADDVQAALELCALVVRCEGHEGVVRIHAGRSRRPRGIHVPLGRGVQMVLRLALGARPASEYELPVGTLTAHLVRHVYYPGTRTIELPAGVDLGDITPVAITPGDDVGVLRAGSCDRLSAIANRAGRFEDMVRFAARDRRVAVGMHCPLPGQAGHKIRLSEQPVSEFTTPDPIDSFGVPWTVALGLTVIGAPVRVVLNERTVGFHGPRGDIVAPRVALDVR